MNQTSQQPSLERKAVPRYTPVSLCLLSFFQSRPRLRVRHHWHEEIEIIYLHHGFFQTGYQYGTLRTDQECFLFINSGELHSLRSLSIEFDEQAVVFSPSMLLFQDYDSIDESIFTSTDAE